MADSGYGCSFRKIEIKIKSAVKTMLLFGYLFNVRPFFLPGGMQSKVVSFFIMMAAAVICNPVISIQKTGTFIKMRRMVFYQIFLFLYSLFLLFRIGRGTGELFLAYIIRLCVFGIGGAVVFYLLFRDLHEFMVCLRSAVLLQSVLIILFLLFPGFQLKMDELFAAVSNTENAVFREKGYITGVGCFASAGFLKMAPGIAASIYLVLEEKHYIRNTGILLFILMTGSMLARTGFIFAVIALLVLLYGAGKSRRLMKKTVTSLTGAVVLGAFAGCFIDLSSLFGKALYRLERLLIEGFNDPFFASYQRGASAVIPEISWDTIRGIGVVSGYSGNGIRIDGVDGGYLRLYAAIGIPLMVITYIVLLWLFFSPVSNIKNRKLKSVLIFMMFYIVLGEIKEFFIYTGFAIGIYYAMLVMYENGRAGNV